jgi:MFS transporter, ACS family, D-galactonate transporter
VGLLFLFMRINFADWAALGLSAVPIMQDLGLTRTQFGLMRRASSASSHWRA